MILLRTSLDLGRSFQPLSPFLRKQTVEWAARPLSLCSETEVNTWILYEVIAHAQSDSPEDAREICADGTYFPNNLRMCVAEGTEWGSQYVTQDFHQW